MVGPIAMLSFVRLRLHLSFIATISALFAPLDVAHADDPASSTSTNSTNSTGETDEQRFRRFKAEGDRALAEKRLNDAIKAYNDARDVRRDPLIAGRMGLALSFFDDPEALEFAADLLYEAVADVAGVSSREKDAFFAAYKRVRKLVCKLSVNTNDVNARTNFGDGYKKRIPSFFRFVRKGRGEAVAQLDDRDDIHKSWNCVGDQEIEIRFDFPPKPEPRSKTITVVEPGKETVKIVRESIPEENVTAKLITTKNHWSVWFGPNVTFGVTPSPAYGLSISSAYNFSKWSMMIGARGAYAYGPIERNPLDVFAFSGLAGPCLREKWFHACAFFNVNFIQSIPTGPTPGNFQLRPQITPGIGLSVGGRRSISNKIGFYLSGEASILSRDVEIVTPRATSAAIIWNGGQFLATISVGLELKP
jgi:hypothetical protein